ncbi:MAG: tetratricopeptide repeat protein [Armatimonadetes bacterium]|nr:tetratricopeptide repeat protein [Armatimonadota bacterium]
MFGVPSGTVTFLFTDLEGSTRLLQDLGDRYAALIDDHHRLLRAAFQDQGGAEIEDHGDGLFYAFGSARAALVAAIAAQRAVLAHPWPEGVHPRVRMGLHTGEPLRVETHYVGIDVHRAARICAAGHGGQILLSQTLRDLIADDLPQGVGLRDLGPHRLKDLQHPERLFQVLHHDLPSEFPTLKSLDARPNNLPRQLTSFIGRQREMDEVKRFLSVSRIATLTGTGGCGKTRLALHVGADLLETFPDGVWLVELGALSEPALVPQSVAAALRVREEPGRSMIDTLSDYLSLKHLLLVLDNCEHLVEACARLAETLLRTCPRLRILATSREALRVPGEVTYHVPSLSLPDLDALPSVERLMQSDAVRLFVDRAMLSQPAFGVDSRNAAAVAQVCRRLDGIPLALELAATRVKLLSVDQIARRLDDRFRLLTAGSRTTLPQHQTLRAAMDWSYELLSDQERILLRRLSVFAGGFALDAAETICAGGGIAEREVLDLLARLVDKSLLMTDVSREEARYRLLETVRDYAREKLEQSSEAEATRGRHRDWFLAVAERSEPELTGRDQSIWLDRLEREVDNLRAALEWSQAHAGEATNGLRLAAALWYFWVMHGYFSEGRRWLEATFISGEVDPAVRAKALYGAGILAYHQGDYARAARLGEEGLALSRRAGNDLRRAGCLAVMGLAAVGRGDYAQAAVHGNEALALFRTLGDHWGIALSLVIAGVAAQYHGDYRQAATLFQESLSILREVGDKRLAASVTGSLGVIARLSGNHAQASALLRQSLEFFRGLKDQWGIGYTLGHLGIVARAQGDEALALAFFRESLAVRWRIGDKRGMAQSLAGLGAIACAHADYRAAARLLGAAQALRKAIGAPMSPADQEDFDRTMRLVREHLEESAFATALAEGQSTPLEQVVAAALQETAA